VGHEGRLIGWAPDSTKIDYLEKDESNVATIAGGVSSLQRRGGEERYTPCGRRAIRWACACVHVSGGKAALLGGTPQKTGSETNQYIHALSVARFQESGHERLDSPSETDGFADSQRGHGTTSVALTEKGRDTWQMSG